MALKPAWDGEVGDQAVFCIRPNLLQNQEEKKVKFYNF